MKTPHRPSDATSAQSASDRSGPRAAWRTELAQLVNFDPDRASAAAEAGFTPLALQFEVRELIPRTSERWNGPTSRAVKAGQETGSGEYRLGVRPAMRTQKGWARGALTWANIGHRGGSLNLDAAQQRWFRQLYAVHRAAETITVGFDANWVLLDDFVSPVLWSMLGEAERLGISLISAGTHTSVKLHATAQLSLEASAGLAGDLTLRPALLLDGTETPLQDCGATGDHGLYLAEHDGERAVHLAPVAGGLSPAEVAMLRAGTQRSEAEQKSPGIVVPADERDAFLTEALPALRQSFRVSSRDGSAQLPAPRPRSLRLTAAWRRGHKLTLSWTVVDDGAAYNNAAASPPILRELLPLSLWETGLLPDDWNEPASAQTGELPPPVELRDADAAEFLTRAVPELRQIEGIEVRQTGAAPRYQKAQGAPKLVITTVPSETEDWFDLGVLVTVDGKTVPFAPLFRALATGKKKLLLVDHTYLYLNHPALAPLAELIAEGQDLDEWEAGVRITRHQAAFIANFEDLAEESEEAVRWRALVRDVGRERPEPVPVPRGLNARLRPYQRAGFHWLAFLWRNRLGGVLADDMGLGKTLQCLALIAWAKESSDCTKPVRRPFLVVAPTSVVSNWAAEAARFTPGLRVVTRTATEASSSRTIASDAAQADVLVTSYALFRLDYEKYRGLCADPDLGLAGLILDEAQFVKNARSIGNELAVQLPVAWKLAVTGTPMENSLRELHAISQIVAPGLFPSARRFEEEYVRAIERPAPGISKGRGAGSGPEAQAGLRAKRLEALRRRLRPFLLRRTKELVATELPEKLEQVLEIELAPAHRQLYDAFLQRERQKLYGLLEDIDRHRFTVFRSLTLLRMLAIDASLIDEQYADLPSAKLDALAEQATELAAEGRRALVFSQFTSFLDLAEARLRAEGVRTVRLDGSTRNRDAVIEAFRLGEADVFLISLKAGGVGLNLTEADTVLLLDPWWNPASEAQAIDRTHRIGQQAPVHVLRMIALGTIEEKVLALQRRKRALFDAVVDDEALFAQALTADDVRELLGDTHAST